ncbi:MAG: DNA primase [Thermoanaerobaculia bacterium]|nr:DNA primase [Thermoanaerobaculia bacterium]
MQNPNLLSHALAYARELWLVLALRPRGKEPLTPHGVKDATSGAAVIQSWWARWPDANIGLAIPPGLVVLDIDSADALQHLHAEGLDLPATVRATTGRGIHLWYATGAFQARNRVAIFRGVDVRAPGGYIVAPPSIHPSGAVYRWEVELRRSYIAPCPGWLTERLTPASPSCARSSGDWHQLLTETVPEGRRNDVLTRVIGYLLRNHNHRIAADLAYCWAKVRTSPPLPDDEIFRTIDSIAGRELRRRKGLVK